MATAASAPVLNTSPPSSSAGSCSSASRPRSTDTSALTAIGNDTATSTCSRVRSRRSMAGDVLIAITRRSGTSKNVVAAVTVARELGMKVIALTGAKGAAFVASCDAGVAVPSTNTARIQETTSRSVTCCARCSTRHSRHEPPPAARPRSRRPSQSLFTLPELVAWREERRARKQTVVWTSGVFDVLHVGHLHSLREARSSVTRSSSASTPTPRFMPTRARGVRFMRVKSASSCSRRSDLVDAILMFDDPTPEAVLAQLKPDVHVKGGDYANKPIPGARSSRRTAVASSSSLRTGPLVERHARAARRQVVSRSALFLDRDGA